VQLIALGPWKPVLASPSQRHGPGVFSPTYGPFGLWDTFFGLGGPRASTDMGLAAFFRFWDVSLGHMGQGLGQDSDSGVRAINCKLIVTHRHLRGDVLSRFDDR
jgi:hypothetical protein